jgi:peptidyl-prolyl cis-trans isomerase C
VAGKAYDVNGVRLEWNEVRAHAASMRAARQVAPEFDTPEWRTQLQDQALELLIDRILLVQEAERLELTPTEAQIEKALEKLAGRADGVAGCRAGADTPETRSDLRRRWMIDQVLTRWRAMAKRPSSEEIKRSYRAHRDLFLRPEQAHVAHFVREHRPDEEAETTRQIVERARERVLGGENLEAMAAESSDCPENAGDLGWIQRGVMVDEFEEAIFAAKPGQLTPVFKTLFGFHFARVYDVRPAGIPPLHEVRSELENRLLLAAEDRIVGDQLASLRAKAEIKRVV